MILFESQAEMNKYWQDFIVDVEYLEETAQEIYESEINYNNADPTTGQRCWSFGDIFETLEYYVK